MSLSTEPVSSAPSCSEASRGRGGQFLAILHEDCYCKIKRILLVLGYCKKVSRSTPPVVTCPVPSREEGREGSLRNVRHLVTHHPFRYGLEQQRQDHQDRLGGNSRVTIQTDAHTGDKEATVSGNCSKFRTFRTSYFFAF